MSVAVVTGSASGIGEAVCRRLEKQGDRIVGVDIHGAEVQADLSTSPGRRAAVDGVRAACPDGIDRLVLCAGLGSHLEDTAKIVSVNYFGAVDVLDGLRDDLAGRPGAAAVAVCSNSAQLGPFQEHPVVLALLDHDEARAHAELEGQGGYIAYGGSKHALSRAIRRRAGEFGRAGVRLNGIAPGTTQTPLLEGTLEHPVWGKGARSLDIPLERWAEPDEIASVIAFLLGPDASYVHGSIVFADGGNDAAIRPDQF